MTPAQRARAHEILDELLDLVAGGESNEVPIAPVSKPRRRRRMAAPSIPEPDDVAKQRAARGLRRRGISVE